MKKMNTRELAEGTGGKVIRDCGIDVQSVSTDSRSASATDIFVPLIGEVHDAHKFVPGAYENGCRVFVVSESSAKEFLENQNDVTLIEVEDTNASYRSLARYYLDSIGAKKIAVTGSTGKTTTRDMVTCVCGAKYKTACNKGNLNNLFGVPATILGFDQDVEVAVLEMGMDRFGEIDALAEAVRPDIGIITNIGVSHIENLGSRDGIFKAKMEITNYFGKDNVLIAFRDDEYLNDEGVAEDRAEKGYRFLTTGYDGRSRFIISGIDESDDMSISFTLEHDEEVQRFTLPVPGAHNIWNASVAVAAGAELGISMSQAAEALANLEVTDQRLTVKVKDGIRVIDDTYNASPASMMAAIDVLMTAKGIRKVAILADMFELGQDAPQYHRQVGEHAGEKNVDLVVAVGELSKNIEKGALSHLGKERVKYYKTREACLADLSNIIEKGDVVLVKGSHGMEMDKVVDRIIGKQEKS